MTRKVVVCTPIEEEGLKQLHKLDHTDLLKGNEVEFVHCFEVQMYTYEFMAAYYPTEEQFKDIESSVTQILDNLTDELKPFGNDKTKFKTKCLRSTDPKNHMLDYLKNSGADVAVVATRGKHGLEGLFSSSFADYMIKHAPCDLYILRP